MASALAERRRRRRARARARPPTSARWSRASSSRPLFGPGLRSRGETTGAACLEEQSDGWTGRSVTTQSWTGRSETAQSDARMGYMGAKGSKGSMRGAAARAWTCTLRKRVLFRRRDSRRRSAAAATIHTPYITVHLLTTHVTARKPPTRGCNFLAPRHVKCRVTELPIPHGHTNICLYSHIHRTSHYLSRLDASPTSSAMRGRSLSFRTLHHPLLSRSCV